MLESVIRMEDMIIGNGFHPPPRILDRTFPLVNIFPIVQKFWNQLVLSSWKVGRNFSDII